MIKKNGTAIDLAETEAVIWAFNEVDNLNSNREEVERQRWDLLPEQYTSFYEESYNGSPQYHQVWYDPSTDQLHLLSDLNTTKNYWALWLVD